MKINKMTIYAFLIIKRIYMGEGSIVTSKYIAEKEQISQGVVLKTLRILQGAGIVISHQGRGEISGGFSLIRNIKDLSVCELLIIMEREFSLCPVSVENASDKGSAVLYKNLGCMNDMVVEILKRYSLFDVLTAENLEKNTLTYQILKESEENTYENVI